MIGKTLSHYKIIAELGRGGMGVVYKAEDTKLGREVALKFLANHLTDDPTSKERFIREARAAAVLQHDAICAIHDVQEAEDGTMYIVMPYYEGKTLREVLSSGALSPDRAVPIGRQILEGLSEAHSRNLIHRDIKPGNILITGADRVKILDFGLAKVAGEIDLTLSSSTVGTMAYMSPEQIQNEPVDARSDLWSFGVLLYEMLTGDKPFAGTYDAAVIYSIINQEIDFDNDRIPVALRPVLARMLSKDRYNRFASADAVLQVLGALDGSGSGTTHAFSSPSVVGILAAPPVPVTDQRAIRWVLTGATLVMIVVLVLWRTLFTDPHLPVDQAGNGAAKSGNAASSAAASKTADSRITIPEIAGANASSLPTVGVMYIENNSSRERLGFVLRDMLARNLGQVDRIQVVSNQRLKDLLAQEVSNAAETIDAATATRIARKAGITTMILGSVVQFGDEYILEAELTDVETGNIIDAVSATATSESEIMGAVDELTAGILNGSGKLTAGEDGLYRIEDVSTGTLSAYELYEKGVNDRDHWRFSQAAQNFKAAIAIDSTFIAAYLEAAFAMSTFSMNPLDDLAESRAYIAAARRHTAHATPEETASIEAQNLSFQFPDNREDIRAVRALADRYPEDKIKQLAATSIVSDAATYRYFDRLFELDPSFAIGYNGLAYQQLTDGLKQAAVSSIKKYRALQPDVGNTMDSAWEVMTGAGEETEAIQILDAANNSGVDAAEIYWRKMYTLAVAWDSTGAWDAYRKFASLPSTSKRTRNRRAAHIALSFGQWDRAKRLSATALRASRRSRSDKELLSDLRAHAAVLHAVGYHIQAEEVLSEMVEISRQVFSSVFNPVPVIATYQNGVGYADVGDRAGLVRSIANIADALEAPGLDRRHTRYAFLLKANLSVLDRDLQQAAEDLDAANIDWFSVTTTHYKRTQALVAGLGGNLKRALSDYDLAEHLIQARDFDVEAYSSFFINHARIPYDIARMFDDRGDRDEAVRRYRAALNQWSSVGADFRFVDLAKNRLQELGATK